MYILKSSHAASSGLLAAAAASHPEGWSALAFHHQAAQFIVDGGESVYAQPALLGCQLRVRSQGVQLLMHLQQRHAVVLREFAVHQVVHGLIRDAAVALDARDGRLAGGTFLAVLAGFLQLLQAHACACKAQAECLHLGYRWDGTVVGKAQA